MTSSTRISTLLLLICSISLPTSIVLAGYFLYRNQEIENLKSHLLSKNELQAQLLAAQPLEQAVMPHLVRDIGFVLNPAVKRSSFKAHKGDTYHINSLGLRGAEIKRKKEGVKRILIVGDSVVFGWKLEEKNKLSSLLNQYASERINAKQETEFITVALPGWNVKSERAFLDSHLHLLDPDLILWKPIANDIEDVGGVIPPGYLAQWASPHRKNDSAFTGLSRLHKQDVNLAMPFIMEKYKENIALITSFQTKYGIPILLLDFPILKYMVKAQPFDKKQIFIPKKYKKDTRWKLSTTDRHPTPWANHIIAVGILGKLIRSGIIPEITFTPKEMDIVRNFEKQEKIWSKIKNPTLNSSNALNKIPSKYERNNSNLKESILYGITSHGAMAKAGTLFLRDPANSSHIILHMEPPLNIEKYPGTANFTVRNRGYEKTLSRVKIDAKHIEIRLALPKKDTSSSVPVYEISWVFDFLLCTKPSSCSVGNLLEATFE